MRNMREKICLGIGINMVKNKAKNKQELIEAIDFAMEFSDRILVEKAVQGMLPHNKLDDRMRTHLYVYEGAEHPHGAQKPIELK